MSTKTITWKGPDRVLPGVGEARTNETIVVPRRQAESYIAQGLAETAKAPRRNKTSVKGEEE